MGNCSRRGINDLCDPVTLERSLSGHICPHANAKRVVQSLLKTNQNITSDFISCYVGGGKSRGEEQKNQAGS